MGRLISTIALIGLLASGVGAQVPAHVKRVVVTDIAGTDSTFLKSLGKWYHSGQYDSLANSLRTNLEEIDTYDSSRYTSVVFISRPPTQEDEVVVRLLLPPTGPVTYPHRAPGVTKLNEVFLTSIAGTVFESAWISTREDDPLQAEVVSAAKTVFPALASIAEATREKSDPPDSLKDTPRDVIAVVNEVTLPYDRAVVEITSRVHPSLAAKTLKGRSARTRAQVRRGSARLSVCADSLAVGIDRVVQAYPDSVLKAPDRKKLADEMLAAVDAELQRDSVCTAEVAPGGDPGLMELRSAAVSNVIQAFVGLIIAPDPIVGSTKMSNTPLSRFSAGLIAGAMLERGGSRNYASEDGVIRADDLSGLVTGAVLHWHPIPFDRGAPDITPAERFSVFGGMTLTPSPGFIVGGAWKFFRGLGAHASIAWLQAQRLREGYKAGYELQADDDDPFQLGFTHALILGLTYNLE